jgi:phosphate:Na+ symporter
MDYSLLDFIALLGSICLFLYGLKVMSEGLQKAIGDRLRSILKTMTRNRWTGVATGILITALIQSSSASTVMVVSFVNAGLMSLEQSMAVIFGANLGSTFTSWLVAILGFKVSMSVILLPLLAFAVPMLFFKKNQVKSIGEFLIGLVFLFMGLAAINAYVPDLSKSPEIFEALKNYTSMGFWSMLMFMGAGLVVTMIIQSSAATFALVLALAIKGWMPFDMACAVMLGANVGTTITPLLASLRANVAAKKAAMGHLMYNIFTAVIMLVLFFPFTNGLIVWLTRDVLHAGDPTMLYNAVHGGATQEALQPLIGSMSIGLALWHTVYNILSLLTMIWFTKQYVKLVNGLVKSHNKEEEEFQLKYIQGGLLNAGELNIMQAKREIVVYSERVNRMLGMVKQLIHTKTGTEEFNSLYTRIGKYEEISDRMEIEIANYLNKVVDGRLSFDAKMQVASMLRCVSEIESIADSCYNIGRTLVRKEEANAHFGAENYKNIDTMLKYVSEAMSNMIVILSDTDSISNDDLMRSYDKEREINNYRNLLRTENIENINRKKYPYQAGIFYMDIVGETEKMGDYIINVIDGVNEQRRRNLVDQEEAMASLKMEEAAKHKD